MFLSQFLSFHVCKLHALYLPWGFGKVCSNNKIPSFEVLQVCELLNLLEHTIAIIKAPGFRNAPMFHASATTFLEYINKSGHNNTTDLRYSKRISYHSTLLKYGALSIPISAFFDFHNRPDLHGSCHLFIKFLFLVDYRNQTNNTSEKKNKIFCVKHCGRLIIIYYELNARASRLGVGFAVSIDSINCGTHFTRSTVFFYIFDNRKKIVN